MSHLKKGSKLPFPVGDGPRLSTGFTRFTSTSFQISSLTSSKSSKPSKSYTSRMESFPVGGNSSPKPTRTRGFSSLSRPQTMPSPRSKRRESRPASQKILHDLIPKSGLRSPRTPERPMNVVLPPRRFSSDSSVEERQSKKRPNSGAEPVVIKALHFSSSYTPHKAYWVKKALESLGGEWVRQGKMTNAQLVSAEFEEKMGVLYDLAMARKHQAIDRLVTEELDRTGIHKNSKRSPRKVPTNFPFAPHITGNVKESMSEALLQIMMRGDEIASKVDRDKTESMNTPLNSGANSEIKDLEDASSATNSFEKDLTSPKRSLVQCYVIEGKLVAATERMLSVGGSIVNKFEESKKSRFKRIDPLQAGKPNFFRATCNMMGFRPHEVTVRFCSSSKQLIVSAARPKRGNDNARQVRETVQLPKNLDIFGSVEILVMRTFKGSLIFEEMEETK